MVNRCLETPVAEELVFLLLELVAQGINLMGRRNAPKGREENRVLPGCVRSIWSLQLRRREFPIRQMVQKGLHEVLAAILVVQIVGMLPHVARQQRGLPVGRWRICIRGLHDLHSRTPVRSPFPVQIPMNDSACRLVHPCTSRQPSVSLAGLLLGPLVRCTRLPPHVPPPGVMCPDRLWGACYATGRPYSIRQGPISRGGKA